jgi:hypothetical protein
MKRSDISDDRVVAHARSWRAASASCVHTTRADATPADGTEPTVSDVLAEIQQALAQFGRMRKTIICPPELVADLEALIQRHSPAPGLWTVQPSKYIEPGYIYVIDASALDPPPFAPPGWW